MALSPPAFRHRKVLRLSALSQVAGDHSPDYLVNVNRVPNCEEFIGKTVGKRFLPPDPLSYTSGLQRTLGELSPFRIKRGVYKFCTHEEADKWLMDHLILKQID